MSASQPSSQDFRQAQSSKRKRGLQTTTDRTTASSSSSFFSPNHFAVLSDCETETEELNCQPQPSDRQPRIPPILIYSFLTNHSSTLHKVNNKLSAPVEVKTKSNRLLLYTKSTQDYNTVLSEIQAAKLEYHTYPLPDTRQTRLVLKGIPPNVPEDDIRETLAALDIQTVKLYQITKTDKSTREVLTRYPIFVVTFPPGTDMRKVLQISKLWNCIIRWEKYKHSRPVQQWYNCQTFGHSSNFYGKSSKYVKCDQPQATKDCKKTTGFLSKWLRRPSSGKFFRLPTVFSTDTISTTKYSSSTTRNAERETSSHSIQLSTNSTSALKPSALPLSQQSTWAQVTSRSAQPTTARPLSSVADTIKSLLVLFDYQKLYVQLRSLLIQLQEPTDPITKLVAIIDTIITCFSTSNHPLPPNNIRERQLRHP